jgi:hypothetical protein
MSCCARIGVCPTRTTWNAGLRRLAIEHAGTRWSALRLDDDVEEIRDAHREHTERFDALDRHLQEHTGRSTLSKRRRGR